MRLFFRVEYDGSNYGGWQHQDTTPSIQDALEHAFSTALRAPCRVIGAGRTDAGVHAKAQGAHLDVDAAAAPDLRACELSVNSLLPPDIAIYRLQRVDDEFHARFSAVSRRYRYALCQRKRPLLFKRVWMVFYDVNWERAAAMLPSLCGAHDFSAFCASGSGAAHARCTVTHASLEREGNLLIFTIEANRFVYTMVRSIVGTLVDIGRGRLTDTLADIIESKDRRRAGMTAPACGLVPRTRFFSGSRLMKHPMTRAGLYVLLVALGAACGLIAGGEVIRHVYGLSSAFPLFEAKKTTAAASVATEQTAAPSGDALSMNRDNAIVSATRAVAPCVVGIVVTQIQVVRTPYYTDDFFDFFFSPDLLPRYRQVESMGSGFVIRGDGMILTNYHVVQNAAKLYVNFPDGRRIEGKVVGADERTDIAVVSVNDGAFKAVKFGDSDESMIGEWAIAIGNPFLNFINDAHPTVTVGVVSALNRNFAPAEGVYYQGMIQTDAAINPGNSGGPLVNAAGEVIGINTFIYTGSSNSRGSIGIGFAIPIERARRVAEELIRYGHRRDVWTGIAVQNLDRSAALALGYDRAEGVVIMSVERGSPGETAGVKSGDIIQQIGSRYIQSHSDIDGFFLDYFVGDTVHMNIIRHGTHLSLPLVLKQAPTR